MADEKVADATLTLLTSFQEANRVVAEHLVAAQQHNRKLAEDFFTEGMEVLQANQQAIKECVAAQERNVQYTQRFFSDGMEMLKANQAAAQSLVATQERTMQYAGRFFSGGIEVLKSQAESMRALLEDLERQVSRQREALETLVRAPVDITFDIFSAPLAAYQRALDVAGAFSREGFKWVERAAEQAGQADKQTDPRHDE
jgi:hypothetical protein